MTAPPLVFSNLAYFLVLPCVGATFLVYVAHWLKHKGQFGDNQPSRVGSWLAAIWGFFGTCWLLGGVEIVGRHFVGPTIAAAIWAVEALGLPVVGVAAGAWWLTHNESKRPVARAVLIGVGTGLTHVACAAALADFSWGLVPASIAFFVMVFFNLPSVRRDIGAWRQRRAKEHMFRAAVAPGSGFESLPLPTEVTGELQPSGNAARDGNPGVAASENGEDQPPSKEKVLFWQAVVEITRGPAWLPDHTQAALAYLPPVGGMSWLAEFLPNQAYAYHLTMDKGPRVELLARCAAKDDALEVARTMFEEIRYRFRGVHGQIHARPVTARTFADEARKGYAELALPTPPFTDQLALVEKLASVTASTPHAVEFYILWRRPSWLQDLQARRQYGGAVNPLYAALLGPAAKDLVASSENGERYSVRVFATAQLGEGDTEASLLGRLGAIQVGIENRHREAARWAFAPAGAWQQVIACKFRGGRVIPPEKGRFDFPASLALPHGFILARESYTPLPGLAEDDPRYIVLGDVLVDGAPSTYKAYAAVAHLPTSVSVLGAPGHGKSTLIASVVDQLAAKCPGVGILIPNLAKAGEGARYPFARRVSWKDPHFGIPWFVEGSVHATACERFANNLTAVLGLKDPYPQIIQNALAWGDPRFAGVPAAGQVPASFRTFVTKLQAYIQAHPYAEDTQADIIRALENRIKRLDTAEFDEMTRLDRVDAPFRWFEDWLLRGGRIFLDLHDAPDLVKNFVTFTLFQLIQEHAPQAGGILRNLIIIDEAHKVFRRPADTDPYKAEVIAARRMNELLCDYLDELRSRGCALLISDQEPRNLVPAAYEKPGLKVYFHLSGFNAQLVLPDSPDRAVLDQLPTYEAIVHDGATGQFYSMQTRPPRSGTEPSREEVERQVTGARIAIERRLRGGSTAASGEAGGPCPERELPAQDTDFQVADPTDSSEDSGQDIDLALLKLEQEILRDGSPGGNEDQLKEVEREIKEIELGMSNDAKSSNALSAQPAKNPPSGGSELVDEPSIPLTSNRDVTPASEIPPSNSELEYFGTEECAQVFSDSPDYVHPSLTTAQNLLFLKTRAQQAWKIGDCPLAYRLWYATFNNELRLATRHVPQIPEGDIFLAGKYIWDYLASRGIKCDATIMNYFLGAHSAHARLLRSASFLSKADVGKVLNPIENGVEELLYKASILPVVQNNLADVGFDHQGDVNAAP